MAEAPARPGGKPDKAKGAAEAPTRARQEVGPGARRAAAVLLGIGPETALPLFRMLNENEVRRLAAAARELRAAAPGEVPAALQGFVESLERVGGDTAASDEVLRRLATEALGADVARRAFEGAQPPPEPDEVLGPIAQADPEALAMVLSREHAQTIALVLSAIDTERAISVLERLSPTQRPLVLKRMATVDAVAPEVLREVGQALSAELRAIVAGGVRKVDGKLAALQILRKAAIEEQTAVISAIEQDDLTLAAELRAKLFTFTDLSSLIDRDIQTLLKELDVSKLAIALKGADLELRNKFMKNMSSRAAEMLKDDLEALGPVKLSVVESTQAEIVQQAMGLAEQGRITIVRATDKMV